MSKIILSRMLFLVFCTTVFFGYLSSMNTPKKKFYKKKYSVPSGLPEADHYITIFSNEKFPYIKWIATRKKTAEGRVNSPFFEKLKKENTVVFYNKKKDYVLCKIKYLYVYESFYQMLQYEGVSNMLPNIDDINKAERIYLQFPGSERVKKYGALAIGVTPIKYKY